MAAGDELIDYDDRVAVLNRVIDAPVEITFAGRVQVWKPGETRYMQRLEAISHYVPKSTILWDPTRQTYPVQRLVIVDQLGDPIEPGASSDPLDAQTCAELQRFGIIDDTNLPSDRYFDEEKNQAATHRELRRVARGSDPTRRQLRPLDKEQISRELDDVVTARPPL